MKDASQDLRRTRAVALVAFAVAVLSLLVPASGASAARSRSRAQADQVTSSSSTSSSSSSSSTSTTANNSSSSSSSSSSSTLLSSTITTSRSAVTTATTSPPTTVRTACAVSTNPADQVAAGARMTVQGSGCRGATEVGIQSDFVRLAAVTPDANGAFGPTVVVIPSNIGAGSHQVVVRGANAVTLGSKTITVTATGATTTGTLVRTGMNVVLVALVATAALALGSWMRLQGYLPR